MTRPSTGTEQEKVRVEFFDLESSIQELPENEAAEIAGGVCRKAGGTPQEYLVYTMETVFVSG